MCVWMNWDSNKPLNSSQKHWIHDLIGEVVPTFFVGYVKKKKLGGGGMYLILIEFGLQIPGSFERMC
jgi:hypothetical protein